MQGVTVDRRIAAPLPVEDLVAPFLLRPFRLLDKLFTGGRVTAAFGLDRPPASQRNGTPPPPATGSDH
jgi:hypothetical protein